MFLCQIPVVPKPYSLLSSAVNWNPDLTLYNPITNPPPDFCSVWKFIHCHNPKPRPCLAITGKSDSSPHPISDTDPDLKRKGPRRRRKSEAPGNKDEDPGGTIPIIIPRKPRRGRRSEAVAVEDFVRDKLEQTFATIRQQNPEMFEAKEKLMKERADDKVGSDDSDDDDDEYNDGGREKEIVIEEDSPNWPLDADVGWGTRASEYFEKYPIKNVVGEDGFQIDWEGEIDNALVKEINCLEWESFAFRPSPLIVLVFERYNRPTYNWRVLKELENAAKVYWKSRDKLPPRTVKIDINIERDLAYALKVRECPQILFLRGNKIVYREKEMRSADELVHMIAHFYYNAKKPSCIDDAALSP